MDSSWMRGLLSCGDRAAGRHPRPPAGGQRRPRGGGAPNATFTQLNPYLRARMRPFNLRHIQLKKKVKVFFSMFGSWRRVKVWFEPAQKCACAWLTLAKMAFTWRGTLRDACGQKKKWWKQQKINSKIRKRVKKSSYNPEVKVRQVQVGLGLLQLSQDRRAEAHQ